MDPSAIAKVIRLQGELIDIQTDLMSAVERRDVSAIRKAKLQCAQHAELVTGAIEEAFPGIPHDRLPLYESCARDSMLSQKCEAIVSTATPAP